MVIRKLRYSGAYKMFMWLANALCERGHEVTIMTFMQNAVQVLDPTLLLTREDWINNLALKDYFNNSKKIVLIYTLSGSRYIYTLAKNIANKLNAEVVNIKSGYKRVKEDSGIIHVTDAGPQEFITLFSKAVYVITDSFHGTAFSINFNIPFTSHLNPVSNINSRVLSILELCGL